MGSTEAEEQGSGGGSLFWPILFIALGVFLINHLGKREGQTPTNQPATREESSAVTPPSQSGADRRVTIAPADHGQENRVPDQFIAGFRLGPGAVALFEAETVAKLGRFVQDNLAALTDRYLGTAADPTQEGHMVALGVRVTAEASSLGARLLAAEEPELCLRASELMAFARRPEESVELANIMAGGPLSSRAAERIQELNAAFYGRLRELPDADRQTVATYLNRRLLLGIDALADDLGR
jgi:hypothetical protein